jgi:hypothetical protein
MNTVQKVCREVQPGVYINMLKMCTNDNLKEHVLQFFTLINESIMWGDFGFKLMNAMDTRAEVLG